MFASLRACLVLVLVHAALDAQGARLNPPIPPRVVGLVGAFEVTADGAWIVYNAMQDVPGQSELFVAASDGSSNLRLSGLLPAFARVQDDFRLSPDGEWVVFRGDLERNEAIGLHSVRRDGSSAPVHMHPTPSASADVTSFAISPDSTRVAYLADLDSDERFELYSARLDGTQPRVRLSTIPVAGGDVTRLWIAPDSSRVVYLADALTDERDELFSVPLDGSAPAVKLSSSTSAVVGRFSGTPDALFTEPKISPDSSRVVYLDTAYNVLFSAPLDGSTAPRVHGGAFVPGGHVSQFRLSSDSTRIVYHADQELDGLPRLYSTPLASSATGVRLNDPPATAGDNVLEFWLGPGNHVLYRTTTHGSAPVGLFSRPIDASAPSVQLSSSANLTLLDAPFSPDGTRVVYHDTAMRSRVVDGAAPEATLGNSLPRLILSDGSGVLGVVHTGGDIFTQDEDLFVATLDGSAAERLLIDGETSDEFDELRAAGGQLVFELLRGGGDPRGASALQRIPLSGSVPPRDIPPHLATAPSQQDVSSFRISPDQRLVAFSGDLRTDLDEELYVARADGGDRPRRLAHLATGAEVRFSGDSRRILARAPELTSFPVDGSAPAFQFESSGVPSTAPFELTPDGATVVYPAGPPPFVLRAAPVDGSSPSLALGLTPEVQRLMVSATHAVYVEREDAPLDEEIERLRSVPLDGSGPVVTIREGSFYYQVFHDVLISPDGARVVFLQATTSSVSELWSAPIDGSAPPVKLNTTLVSGGSVTGSSSFGRGFALSPDSTRVVYRADQDVDERHELFSVPIAGGTPVRLHAVPSGSRDVDAGIYTSFRIAPDGLVLFRANHAVSTRFDLYSVPLDGSAAPTLLTGAVGGAGNVWDRPFEFAPNGSDVVFLFHALPELQLWAVPRTGGTPRRLSPDLPFDVSVWNFGFVPGSEDILFTLSDPSSTERLYQVPISAARPARQLGASHTGPVKVTDFQFAVDQLVYRADRAVDEVYELWRLPLQRVAPVPR